MTNQEYIIWLKDFLSNIDEKSLDLSRNYPSYYSHTTILKTINDKLKEVCEKE